MTKKKGEQAGRAGNDPEEWKRSVLATLAGQLYLVHRRFRVVATQ